VKDFPENVIEVGLKATFKLRLSMRQFVVWIEAINNKSKEDDEWIQHND
jgi:hypothetical protein